jgi:HSP20 family protein
MEEEMVSTEMTKSTQENGARAVRRVTPFTSLQQEIERVFDNFGARRGFDMAAFTPSMEVTETEKAIEVTTELPGIDEKDVEISLSNDVLTIRGEKRAEKEETNKSYRLVERSYGAFERALALPPGIDGGAIKASMDKGVLKITLPKPAAAQAQKIKIVPN